VTATLAGALVPGAGHLLLRLPQLGGLFFCLVAAGAAVAVWHLTSGLDLFETDLGSFLFGVMLRGAAILHAYSVLDAYLLAVDTAKVASPRPRQAVLLNLLVPGTGYLLARAWLRAGVGLAVLVLILYFAKVRKHPYLDVVYVALQLIMSVAVYVQMTRGSREPGMEATAPPPRPQLPKVPAAQIIVLVVTVIALLGCGLVVQRSVPPSWMFGGITTKDIQAKKRRSGIQFSVPRLDLSITAFGPGWKLTEGKSRFLISAEHEKGATLMVGIQPIPPFVRTERYLTRVRSWMESNNLTLKRTSQLDLGGLEATQMEFSGDHWTIAIPRKNFAYVMMLGCRFDSCQDSNAIRKKTRDSFRAR
jgi:hypothetical protein